MGLIIQFQRRAIEQLRTEPEAIAPPAIEHAATILDDDGKPLYVAGVSPGYGTCSDVKDMNVLVLSEAPPVRPRQIDELQLAYAVLARGLKPEERAIDTMAAQGVARACVELLHPRQEESTGLIFQRTGKTSIYTNLV